MSTIEGRQITSDGERGVASADGYVAAEGERGEGWLVFSGSMLGIAGTMGLICGFAAIAGSSFYVNVSRYVFGDLKAWGWIVTLVAAVTLCAAFGVVNRSQWARWFGVGIASLQAIAQLLFIQAYPWWSLVVFTLDVLVIYGLSAYGGRLGN